MPDESLQRTREQLTNALSQISLLSAENCRLKSRLSQLRNIDPDRIIKVAEQVTAELRRSEERSDQLLRVIGELRERNKKLEELTASQRVVLDDFSSKFQHALAESQGALGEKEEEGDSDLHSEEDMELVQSKIASLTNSVKNVQGLLDKINKDNFSAPKKSYETQIKSILDSL